MDFTRDRPRLHPAWWTLILIAAIAAVVTVSLMLFAGVPNTGVPIVVASDRSGLVMETGAKVKLRGVLVGYVSRVEGADNAARLQVTIDRRQLQFIPANVQARIKATTAFGAKYVDLIYPSDPSQDRLRSGATIWSSNVTTEVNTVFQNLTGVLHQIDPAKLNAVLSAVSDALRGQGQRIGEATTDANQVLLALNPRTETIRGNWQSLKGLSDTYGSAAQNILTILDAASTTSVTLSDNAKALDSLLVNLVGFSSSGADLLGASKDNLVRTVDTLDSTTSLLMKYNPQLTCTIVGGKTVLDQGFTDVAGGGNGKSLILDTALLLGDDAYRYPDNLPIIGAKGGPGGKPGCGSLPDVSKNFPQRYLVTNTGWGTGLDVRPNPGIGFPGWANYFPVTKAYPERPRIRYPGGPAPGPVPYLGAPPYGGQLYAPDGSPLWPGLPPAPPPGAPEDPAPGAGVEPAPAPPQGGPAQPAPAGADAGPAPTGPPADRPTPPA